MGSVTKLGEALFLVPLERHHANGSDRYSVLLVSPHLRPRDTWRFLVFVVPLALSLLLASIAVVRTRAESRRRHEDAMLQNLHVGVIAGVQEEDGETQIEAANDRAEELLGVPLPAFGAAERGGELLREVIDERRIYPARLAKGNPACSDKDFERVAAPTIDLRRVARLRLAGRSSAYYAIPIRRPREKRRYLLVRASPFLQATQQRRQNAVRTFAVLVEVPEEVADTDGSLATRKGS